MPRPCCRAILRDVKNRTLVFAAALAGLLAARVAIMFGTPLFEPSEARYAAISANMARTGDFLVPRFTYKGTYRAFEGKPPLVFQASGAFCRLFGVNEFAVRLTPFLSFAGLLAILFFVVRRLAGAEAGMLAAGMCATSVALYAAAGICMTDVPLALCSSGALLLHLLHLKDARPRRGVVLGVSALLGLGMLVKGPVALALFGLPVAADAAINRRWRLIFDRRWLPGAALFAAVAAPWFWRMELEQPGFLRYFFVNENILRFLVRDYGDMYGGGREMFRGMAIIWAFVVTLPWSLFAALRPQCLRPAALRASFPLLAVAAVTLFWCLTSRIPLAYLLPVAPLFAAHLALHAESDARGRELAWRALPFAAAIAVFALSATLAFVLVATPKRMPGPAAQPTMHKNRYSYEFYNGPWGRGAPEGETR